MGRYILDYMGELSNYKDFQKGTRKAGNTQLKRLCGNRSRGRSGVL